MVKKYMKKPIAIEVVQWTGDNFDEIEHFSNGNVFNQDGQLYCKTLEGTMKAANMVGDYLIKGVKGEFYFCEKSIFEQTYDEVK